MSDLSLSLSVCVKEMVVLFFMYLHSLLLTTTMRAEMSVCLKQGFCSHALSRCFFHMARSVEPISSSEKLMRSEGSGAVQYRRASS